MKAEMMKKGMHKMPDGMMMKDSAMAKGGMPPALAKHAAMKASKAHKGLMGGGKVGYGDGGMAMVMKDGKKVPSFAADGKGKMASGGMAKKMSSGGMTKMAKGGGIESKGKTKGTMVKMSRGGKAC